LQTTTKNAVNSYARANQVQYLRTQSKQHLTKKKTAPEACKETFNKLTNNLQTRTIVKMSTTESMAWDTRLLGYSVIKLDSLTVADLWSINQSMTVSSSFFNVIRHKFTRFR